MKKLVFFTVLAMLIASAGWAYVNIDDGFEGYNLGVLTGQPDSLDPYGRAWTGVTGSWASNSVEVTYDGSADPTTVGWSTDGLLPYTVENGEITITDNSGASMLFYQDIPELNQVRGTTVIVRAKCPQFSGDKVASGNIIIRDGAAETVISILPDEVSVRSTGPEGAPLWTTGVYALDGTQYHTYAITSQWANNVQKVCVYIDGSTVPAIACTTTGTSGERRVMFGSRSGGSVQNQILVIDDIFIKSGGAFPNNAGLPYVVDSDSASGLQSAKWQSIGVQSTDRNIVKTFPMNWTKGTATLYASIKIDGVAKPGLGGNFSYIRMYGQNNQETVRLYIDRNNFDGLNPEGGKLAILGTGDPLVKNLVLNPASGQWYHIRLDVDIDAKKYDAYVRTDPNDPWELKFANAGWYFPSNGLNSVQWQMYDRGTEWDGPLSVSIDDIRVEGPDNLIPDFSLPGADCGLNPQFRYFTLLPTFEWYADPHSEYHLKVFTKNQVEAANFDPETSVPYGNIGPVADSSSTVQYPIGQPALSASDLGNPPSNIYYVFGKIRQAQSGNWGNWSNGVDFVVVNGAPATPAAPVITAPAEQLTSDAPPVVTWTASGDWDQSRIVITRLSDSAVYYDSNWMTGVSPVNLASVTPALPNLEIEVQYSITVEVRKGCLPGAESAAGYKTFIVYIGPPTPPIITSPVGPYVGLKPVIEFTGRPHSALQAKITSDAAGNNIVWDSGTIESGLFGANCPNTLNTGTTYYAWARIQNPIDWSAWSSASSFTVSRNGETVSIRHMDEAGLLSTIGTHPDDMFGRGIPEGFDATGVTVSTPDCTPGVLRVFDNDTGAALRMQRMPVDLNKGVTFVTAMRAVVPEGEADAASEGWKSASLLVTDTALKVGAAIKIRPELDDLTYDTVTEVSICVNGTTWTSAKVAALPTDFNIIRITGKAGTFGVPSSVTWNVYVNEALALTATDAIKQADLEAGTGSWVTGQIAIGQGSFALKGIFDYDWTAVNCSGAYGPGDWNQALNAYVPGGGTRDWKLSGNTYSSVAAALAGETGYVTISGGNVVINHVTGDAYFIQDVDPNAFSLKVDASTTTANKGKKLNSVSGLLSSDGSVKRIKSPTASIGTQNLAYSPVVMSMKALGGSPCITQLGGISVNNVGKLVRVFGTLPVDPWDDYTIGLGGAQIFYVDDMSGLDWVDDGRDGLPGLRFLIDLWSQSPVSFNAGDVVEIVGISSTESYIDGDTLKTVRKIESPVITKVGP